MIATLKTHRTIVSGCLNTVIYSSAQETVNKLIENIIILSILFSYLTGHSGEYDGSINSPNITYELSEKKINK